MKLLRRSSKASSAKPVSLALQGGGAHGAFQWGVLDRLIEYGGLEIQSITAASAGAMNAVALLSGMLEGGPDGARAKLESFWRAVSQGGARGVFGENLVTNIATDWFTNNPAYKYMEALTSQVTVSPYDFNPLNLNPLRDILRDQIDFKAIRAQTSMDLYIAATAVRTNEAKLFKAAELTAEHVMASACLPDVFQAVDIDGEPYWDGGYLANPPIWPLVECRARDVLLCLLNPLATKKTPKTTSEIMDRLNEISFNASVAAELRAVAVVQDLIKRGHLKAGQGYMDLRFHMISADGRLSDLKLPSKFNTDWSFLQDLKKRGRAAADEWLNDDLALVGETSSVDLGKAFL
ncbi:MAG: patatin-like phospholipase family protein [Caulobacteraceae bacterium]